MDYTEAGIAGNKNHWELFLKLITIIAYDKFDTHFLDFLGTLDPYGVL
jgi:hypothetical protein